MITHETVKKTVNTALSGLEGKPNLSETILSAESHSRRRMPSGLLIASVLLVLVTVTALAFAPSAQEASPTGFWKYEDGEITYRGLEDKYPRTILKNSDITLIAADTENTGTLYYITKTADGQFLNTVTEGGYPISSPVRLSGDYHVRDLCVSSSACYLIADTPEALGQIIRKSVYDDSHKEDEVFFAKGFENENISSISVYENTLLAYNKGASRLSVINLSSLDHTNEIALSNADAIIAGNKYDSLHTAFALTDGGRKLVRINLSDGTVEDTSVSLPEGASGLQRNRYTLFVTGATGQALSEYSVSALSGQTHSKTLTLVNTAYDSPSMREAIRLFNEIYPDIEVVTRIIDDYRAAATELMAGEGGIDILQLTGNWSVSPLPKLLKNGAIADLTDNEHMIKAREGMRNVWGMVSESERQYGAVTSCEICMWEVNPILKNKLGWTPPEGRWTYAELKDLADRVIEYNKTSERHMYLLADSGFIPNFLEAYNVKYLNTYDGAADYETEEFLYLLDLWKYLNDNRLLYPYPDGIQTGRIGSSDMVSNALLRVNYSSLGGYGEKMYILPPTYTENDPLMCETYALVVNMNSEMREEAAHFAAIYASKAVTRYQFYLNYGQFIDKKADYVFIDMYDIRKTSPENEAKWNYALEHAKSNHTPSSLKRIVNTELMPAFLEGSITKEEFADILKAQAMMILGE